MYTIYEIQTGDTLASVASKVGIPIDELAQINGIMTGSILSPGEYIVIPNRSNENMYFKRYTIKDGDTIYSISRKIGVEPSFLLRLNGLNENDIIYQGDTIYVPREGVSFYITGIDETLNDISRKMNVNPNDLANQNNTIYLTNDQLIVYKK